MHGFLPAAENGPSMKRRHRALFLSDLHLGTSSARAEAFLTFLDAHEADAIYLAGDIVDFWRLSRGVVWPASHHRVLQALLDKARQGSRVVFIPGNHDEALRSYCGMNFSGIEVVRDCVHVTACGHRLLVVHGDEFDVADDYPKWMRFIGDRAYEFVLWCDRPLNLVRRCIGLGFWSLSAHLKTRVKAAAAYIEAFENALAAEAKRRGAHGVVCGHVHQPADRQIDGTRYLNCGDWVENCTAVSEEMSGALGILRLADAPAKRPASLEPRQQVFKAA